ncbi:hypothetical protein ABGM91_07515 [Akkermansia muciniphila]|uniref:hypothetical protein n=1 Tax=Akkermansia muciniphila TaxID=239935 RepID=UPI0033A02564
MEKKVSLLVPVRVRAMMIGESSKKKMFSGLSYDFSKLDEEPLSQIIEKHIFSEREQEDPGIHLHWGLPAGLTNGIQDEQSEDITYPTVPNRWLVTRLWTKEGHEKISTKSFIIRSDILNSNSERKNFSSPTYPFTKDIDQPYRYLGQYADASLSPDAAAFSERIRLTATAPANPFFAAFAPMCRNVFAFYDDLSDDDLAGAHICYAVSGWYEDAVEEEPIASISGIKELEEKWGLTVKAARKPDRMICHGFIDNLEWRGSHIYYPSGVPSDPEPGEPEIRPRLALGNSSAEALAALAGRGHGNDERLFHLFMQNSLSGLMESNGLTLAEREMHETAFTPIKPPDIIGIRRKKNREEAAPPDTRTMGKIAAIRKRQRLLFDKYREFLQSQREAFETWYLYTFAMEDRYRALYLKRLQQQFQRLPVVGSCLKQGTENLESRIKALDPGPDYETAEEPDQCFYVPNEPVMVISQLAHKDTQESGILTCRITGQTIQSLTLLLEGKSVFIKGNSLYETMRLGINVPDDVPDLVTEAVLLSPGFAEIAAKKAFTLGGISPSKEQTETLARTIRVLQQNDGEAKEKGFSGEFPDSAACGFHSPSWRPLFIEWQACYYPDNELLKKQPDFKNWQLENGDYTFTGKDDLINLHNERIIEGRMLISDNADHQLSSMVQTNLPPGNQAELLAQAREKSLLSQALSGFHNTLLMKNESFPLALFTTDDEEQYIIDAISGLSPEVLGTKPVFDKLYAPIRGGFLSLHQIRIIDTWGRYQDIKQPDWYVGESLRQKEKRLPLRYAMLPPRLPQASRLRAYWTCSGKGREKEEAGFVETASPICGFLLPNRIDHSLMAYYPNGTLAGSLNLTETGTGIIWKSPPGAPFSSIIPENLDPEMYQIMKNLHDSTPFVLKQLISYINKLFYLIHTPVHKMHAADFMGRPIAVSRISLKMEQLGRTEWYRHNEETGQRDKSHETDVEEAVLPLDLGLRTDMRDGMIGFFLNGDYKQMHIHGEIVSGDSDPYFIKSNRISIPLKPTAEPDMITVLLEPWSDINIITGLLPVKTLRLPEELVSQTVKKMSMTCLAAPIITNIKDLSIPVPRSENTDFIWSSLENDTQWKNILLEPVDGQAFAHEYPQKAVEGFIEMKYKEEPKK